MRNARSLIVDENSAVESVLRDLTELESRVFRDAKEVLDLLLAHQQGSTTDVFYLG